MFVALRASRSARNLARNSRISFRRCNQTSSENHSSLPNASSSKSTEKDVPQDPVPGLKPLSRPLGIDKKPSADPQSWQEKKTELLDYDKHLEKRKHLVKEATRPYFQDFHELRRNGGKTWIAQKVLIREDKALYFPNISGVSLTPQATVHTTLICDGRISLISMLGTTMSEEHVKSFATPTLESHGSNPLFRYVQINLQENPLKGFLVSMFLSSIRARTPDHLQSTYLVSRHNMEYLREPLGMLNKVVGYVYLVDENCKIRWAGCGFALQEETLALRSCTGVLLQRLGKAMKTTDPSKTDSPSRS